MIEPATSCTRSGRSTTRLSRHIVNALFMYSFQYKLNVETICREKIIHRRQNTYIIFITKINLYQIITKNDRTNSYYTKPVHTEQKIIGLCKLFSGQSTNIADQDQCIVHTPVAVSLMCRPGYQDNF